MDTLGQEDVVEYRRPTTCDATTGLDIPLAAIAKLRRGPFNPIFSSVHVGLFTVDQISRFKFLSRPTPPIFIRFDPMAVFAPRPPFRQICFHSQRTLIRYTYRDTSM